LSRIVARLISMAVMIHITLPFINVTSLASMATSVPVPAAKPTSGCAKKRTTYRIRRFKLDGFVDFSFPPALSSSASPTRTFELPWTSPNASPSGSLYRKHPMFVQIAEGLGIRSILHTDYSSTCAKLAAFGLQNGEQVIHETS
jgi:hypothetical protein